MPQSMSRAENCYDNAFMESCFGTIKTELEMTLTSMMDEVIDLVFAWLCKRPEDYSHNQDVWEVYDEALKLQP